MGTHSKPTVKEAKGIWHKKQCSTRKMYVKDTTFIFRAQGQAPQPHESAQVPATHGETLT